nr:unnamed protein product [Callosobruchus analis]
MFMHRKVQIKISTKFNESNRNLILSEFYNLDISAKNALLFRSITPIDARPYSVVLDNQQVYVCKSAFCALYQISRKKVDIIKGELAAGQSAPTTDARGRHGNRPHKNSDDVELAIIAHINRFPTEDHPKSDTCSTCDSGKSNEEHQENVNRPPTNHALAKLTTSKAFYLRQLCFYNLGIHGITTKGHQSVMQTWTEDVAGRGSAEVVSCLWKFVQTSGRVQNKKNLQCGLTHPLAKTKTFKSFICTS